MANMQFGGPRAAPVQGKSVGTIANWAGAVISLGLVIGVAIWGYKLLVRDVSGVPVVRAVEGPARVAPEQPGGSPAAYQGFSVNSVAADGMAAAPAERLVLAPEPVDLSDEDRAVAVLNAVKTASEPAADIQTAAEASDEITTETTPQMASIQALAEQLAAGVTPLSDMTEAPETTETPEIAADLAEPARPEIEGGIALSLRPKTRPATLDVVRETPAEVLVPASVSTEVDAESIPVGTRLAQLGAYDSHEIAEREWDRLNSRFGDYLVGKSRVIQKATSGGRTFYRLRAMGFADINDARRFCSALVAERADCIPLVTR